MHFISLCIILITTSAKTELQYVLGDIVMPQVNKCYIFQLDLLPQFLYHNPAVASNFLSISLDLISSGKSYKDLSLLTKLQPDHLQDFLQSAMNKGLN